MAKSAYIDELHHRCGIYTRIEVVRTILDAVGWNAKARLRNARLLEPAAGDGAFLVEAVDRLLNSLSTHGDMLTAATLEGRICAFELHPGEAAKARRRLAARLRAAAISSRVARHIAAKWVRTGDFLLSKHEVQGFTHVVGNPPYARWSKIPESLRREYEQSLPRRMTRGDLFLPFLDLSLGCLVKAGRLGFLCSDRWRYMAFAREFRDTWLPQLEVERDDRIDAAAAYQHDVDVYPSILVLKRRSKRRSERSTKRAGARQTLLEAGFRIRVGPALGCTPAFVLQPGAADVEAELLAPWLDGSEVSEGAIASRGRRVIVMYDNDGRLRDLTEFPLAQAHFVRYRPILESRAIVRNGAIWYRPIDRVIAADWAGPKLLVPEIAKVPRIALDLSGSIPSHGVYAIIASERQLKNLLRYLRDGGLTTALQGIAPQIKGGYLRSYGYILRNIPVPA